MAQAVIQLLSLLMDNHTGKCVGVLEDTNIIQQIVFVGLVHFQTLIAPMLMVSA